jgi:hypothetical protein
MSGGLVLGRIPLCKWKRATGIEPVLRAWKTPHLLLTCSRQGQPRLRNADSGHSGDLARRDESTQDTALVTATVTLHRRSRAGGAARERRSETR